MRNGGRAAWAATLALLSVACGGPEKSVVDSYFKAANAEDHQTLNSFAAVDFTQKVDSWQIKEVQEESKAPFPMMALSEAAQAAKKTLDGNKKEAGAYSLEHLAEWQQVVEIFGKKGTYPARLKEVGDKYEEFTRKDHEARKELAEANSAIEKEKRIMQKSVGPVDGIESLTGEMQTKKLLLGLTIGGVAKDYTMVIRKYDVAESSNVRVMSRWMIYELEPR